MVGLKRDTLVIGFRLISLSSVTLMAWQNVEDYEWIIKLTKANIKTKQLGAQLIPCYFKFFTGLATKAFDAYIDLLEESDIGVERDAVHKAFIMSLFRLDTKESLTASFKHIGTSLTTDGLLRENFLNFIRDKVFPLKAELLKPQEEIERHMTDLIKKSLGDVSGEEFNMFMDFLRTLSIFGGKAPQERDRLI
ncbi:unnamed protein product [Brassica rapa]|uniref:Uncharacterized protein n=2 Tax=Brassica TaxID=3705 RepID=A0A8D9CW87_BRACM|nr:unnamed protein product [Brassica napus]CAG7864409.1 unnamed protein product [Brassica rapa]